MALTPKEESILPRLISDRTFKQIALDIGTTEQVIKNIAPHIYKKLQVKNREGLLFLKINQLTIELEELKKKLSNSQIVQITTDQVQV